MAIFSKELCKQKLDTWLEAEDAIATGQSYQIGSRNLTRANLDLVKRQIEYWAGKLQEATDEENTGGRNRMYRFMARDL